MRKFLVLTGFILMSACGGSGGGGAGTPPVEGTDYSGSYRFGGVACYNNTLSSLTALAATDSQTSSTLTINGNSYSQQSISSCSVLSTAKIVFNQDNYTFALTNGKYTTSNQGSCSLTWGLTPVTGGTINPSSINGVYSNNQTPPDFNGEYYVNSSNELLLLSTLTVSGSPTDLCFLVYIPL